MPTTMSYGNYNIVPVPLISIAKQYQKTPAGLAVGTLFDVQLQGNIVLITGQGSIVSVTDQIREIRNAFDRDGKYFKIACDGTTLFEGYPRIKDAIQFNQSADNWVNSCPYSIVLEFDNDPVNIGIAGSGENIPMLMPPYISNATESWNFEFDDSSSVYSLSTSSGIDSNNLILRATHEVSAVGKSHYDGPGLTGTRQKEAWQWAKDYVVTQLGTTPASILGSGVLNTTGGWSQYNHFRVQRIGETDGIFAVNETFVLVQNSDGVIEDFQVDIRSNTQEAFTTVGINGSVQGLEQRSYGTNSGDFSISQTKFANASGYFETIRGTSMIYPRVQALIATEGITLNTTPLTTVIGKSPTKGLITYQYEYNNRPSNCITGSKLENITINDENPTDVFARIVVAGRPYGPILQTFNTVTEFKRTVSIDLLMQPATGCTVGVLLSGNNPNGQVADLLCLFETQLDGLYDRVYKERDSVSWEPKAGRYTRSVTWSAVDCDTPPVTDLCDE